MTGIPAPYYGTQLPHYDWIAHHAGRDAKKLALVDLHSGRHYSYGEFDDRIRRLALFLRDGCGVKRGDRVAILVPNTSEVFEVQFACGRLGAVLLPLNWRLTVHELSFICGDATPALLIYDASFTDEAHALRERDKNLRLVMIDGADHANTSYERGLRQAAGVLQPAQLTHADLQTIMYTSGTTGRPKGALITYGMTFWNCVNSSAPARLTRESVTLVILPLFHTGGRNMYANPTFHLGGTVLVQRSFDPGTTLDLIGDARLGITHTFGVPANFLFMLQHAKFAETDFSRIVSAGIGGAPASLSLLEAWEKRGVSLQQGYGMTETSPIATILDPKDAMRKIGSAGLPVLHTEVKLVDENGNPVKPGQVGEIWTRGPNITPGYWNRPDATRESFTDGWLHTGDAAHQDEEGFYYIVDRWKDMYISGGENVYPAEVENAIYELDGIAEAAVIGVPDERWGEVGKAFIVPKPGAEVTEAAILAHCRTRLAKFKVPVHVAFVEALPRNATGKVLKRELRAR
jgi:fatty-acyl-CoA synthase